MEVDNETIVAALTAKFQAARRNIDADNAARCPEKFTDAAGPAAQTGGAPQVPTEDRWPAPCDAAAFHGLAGEVVRAIEPHSEADPVALLVQFLAAFGNCIGRGPYWQAGEDKHYSNLFCLLVGRSPKDRKGASWNAIHRLFSVTEQSWCARINPGLPGAESLLWQVRDAQEPRATAGLSGSAPNGDAQEPCATAGLPGSAPNGHCWTSQQWHTSRDKRLLLVESEFGRVLRQLGQPGNALPALLRQAWKHGNLELPASNAAPRKATGAHISLIGHLTQRELQRHLPVAASAGGLGGHFLWVCVKRSKLLPLGGQLPEEERVRLGKKVESAINLSVGVHLLQRDEAADKLWCELYPRLAGERDGLAANVCGRAEAQVMRLAMLYALLDHQEIIAPCHLEAALALWRYCEASVNCLFDETLGDKMAENIAAVLRRRPEGLTRSDIYNWYMRHKPVSEIRRALALLWRAGLARFEMQNSGGRPSERWFYREGGCAISAISAKRGGEISEVQQAKELTA